MAGSFDPYHKWLGIQPEEQPANHYRLLAVKCFEDDLDVIEAASDQRMAYLRTFQLKEHAKLSAKLLNEPRAKPGSLARTPLFRALTMQRS